jgi:hypothetical protein
MNANSWTKNGSAFGAGGGTIGGTPYGAEHLTREQRRIKKKNSEF